MKIRVDNMEREHRMGKPCSLSILRLKISFPIIDYTSTGNQF